MRYRVVLLIAALAAALSLALPAVAGAGTRYITGTVLTNGGASAHNANCYLYQQLPGGTWNYVAVRSTGSGDQCVFGQWADNYFYKAYAFRQICPGNTWWSDYVNTMVNGSWVTLSYYATAWTPVMYLTHYAAACLGASPPGARLRARPTPSRGAHVLASGA